MQFICDECKFGDVCADYGWSGCNKFTPKPKPIEEQTNEEWLRSATTEELAGALYEQYSWGHTQGKFGKPLRPITDIVKWLKEKHT